MEGRRPARSDLEYENHQQVRMKDLLAIQITMTLHFCHTPLEPK